MSPNMVFHLRPFVEFSNGRSGRQLPSYDETLANTKAGNIANVTELGGQLSMSDPRALIFENTFSARFLDHIALNFKA
jgi:hypothetical protein